MKKPSDHIEYSSPSGSNKIHHSRKRNSPNEARYTCSYRNQSISRPHHHRTRARLRGRWFFFFPLPPLLQTRADTQHLHTGARVHMTRSTKRRGAKRRKWSAHAPTFYHRLPLDRIYTHGGDVSRKKSDTNPSTRPLFSWLDTAARCATLAPTRKSLGGRRIFHAPKLLGRTLAVGEWGDFMKNRLA